MPETNVNELVEYLSQFALEKRVALMSEKAAQRTRYLTVCIENVFQPQNASAILRSAEAFGIQDVHVVEKEYEYRINPEIALSSDKWLNLIRYRSTAEAIDRLKEQGYRIVATVPRRDAVSLDEFDLQKGRAALLFGTELTGLSQFAIACADECLYVPMCGFVESLNVSVSAAITLYSLAKRLRTGNLPWRLSPDETGLLMLDWLKKSVSSSEMILQRFYTQKANKG
jgi:tRNA (guanosine-2'-O-)-methyltransferase